MSAKTIRSEDQLGEKVDRCIADTLLKFGGGLSVGIVTSLVLFKRRSWPVILGSGIGLGMGYSNCQHDFRHPYILHGKKIKATSVQPSESSPDYLVVVDKGQLN